VSGPASRVRVYLPVSVPELAHLWEHGELGADAATAYAVTPALREWYAVGDTEQLEHAALTQASRGCLRLLADQPEHPPRRLVVALDVPESVVSPVHDDVPAAVRLTGRRPLSEVACVLADAPDAATDVAAAVRALALADTGDDDARFVVDGAEGHELGWYATQEIADLLAQP